MLLCNDCKAVYMGKHRIQQSISGANVCPRDCLLARPWKPLLLIFTQDKHTVINVSQRANLYLHYWGGCIRVKRFSDISLASTDVLMFISAAALVKIEPRWLWGGEQQEVRTFIAHTVSFHANSSRGTPLPTFTLSTDASFSRSKHECQYQRDMRPSREAILGLLNERQHCSVVCSTRVEIDNF